LQKLRTGRQDRQTTPDTLFALCAPGRIATHSFYTELLRKTEMFSELIAVHTKKWRGTLAPRSQA